MSPVLDTQDAAERCLPATGVAVLVMALFTSEAYPLLGAIVDTL